MEIALNHLLINIRNMVSLITRDSPALPFQTPLSSLFWAVFDQDQVPRIFEVAEDCESECGECEPTYEPITFLFMEPLPKGVRSWVDVLIKV